MQVGDLVKHNLTDQIGIIIAESGKVYDGTSAEAMNGKVHSYRVMWTTQGLSMFGAGSSEWVSVEHVEVL